MRTILVVGRFNSMEQAIIRRQFKEEIALGKTELNFVEPEKLVDPFKEYSEIRIFAVNMEPTSHSLDTNFSMAALDKISKLRLQFRKKKVIVGLSSISNKTCTLRHKPDFICTPFDFKTKLDARYGWIT